jgi:iron(III) transport system permease protein
MAISTQAIGTPGDSRFRRRIGRPPLPLQAAALGIASLALIPVVYLALRVLDSGGEAWELLLGPRTLQIVGRSAGLTLSVTAAAVVLGTLAAWLVSRTDLAGRRVWTVALCLPLAVPSYVGAFAWVAALGPGGLAQASLPGALRFDPWPEIYGFWGAWSLLTLLTYPYVMLTARSTLLRQDPALEDASRSLGHGEWSTFARVTFPQLRPALGAGALLVALYTLSDFGAVSILRYETFTWAIYNQYRGAFDRTLAALLSLVLVAATLVILTAESAVRGKSRAYRARAPLTRRTVPLGSWSLPARLACFAMVLPSLGLPIAVTVYWLVRGLLAGERFAALPSYAWNSVVASALAAVACGVMAVTVSLLATRFTSRAGRLAERLCYLGYGLPGIVIGLALVFFGARWLPMLYQTLAMLVLAYCVRFLPQAVGAVSASLRQISPRLEEAALSLGRRRINVFLGITLPLAWPGILSGMALVFLTTMKELPVTLLLAPIGFETLATRIWSATSEAFLARAAAPSLVLLILSALSISILLRQEPEQSL